MPTDAARFTVALGETRPAEGDRPSQSRVYRSYVAKDAFPTIDVTTLYDSFKLAVERYAGQPCLGHRPADPEDPSGKKMGPFVFQTYAEVSEKVAAVASGLAAQGLKRGDRVGVYGANCVEWMLALQACNRMSYPCVPLYDSLGENAVEYIVNHSESACVFVDAAKMTQFAAALPKIAAAGPLRAVVYWGAAASAAENAAALASVRAARGGALTVLSLEELLAVGAGKPAEPVPPASEDLCTIMYTSGTTGDPKGVLLTHAAVVATIASLTAYLKIVGVTLGPGDSMLSYLPLAHIFDRTAEEMLIYAGGAVGYWQGDATKLVDDIGALKPTLFIGVPRVFDRIYGGISAQIAAGSALKKLIFGYAFSRKLSFLQGGVPQDKASPLFDKIVFSKIKQRLGGRVRIIVSGGAPLAPHVEEFLKVAMCSPVVQGYGLTETCAASCIAMPDTHEHSATVGPVLPCTELRLESVAEMGYDATDDSRPGGEVLLKGPQLFSGYYKMPDKTAECMDSDGWFHTGDIGILTPEGALKIVDRKKNIFKLSQGEYIAVEKLEATFKKAPLVEQVWVYGNSFKSQLVAVVVPTVSALKAFAKERGIDASTSPAELCKDARCAEWVLAELTAVGKADKLKGFEMVKAVFVEPEAFSVEADLMTPSFKLKRPQLQKRYQKEIDAMYKALPQ